MCSFKILMLKMGFSPPTTIRSKFIKCSSSLLRMFEIFFIIFTVLKRGSEGHKKDFGGRFREQFERDIQVREKRGSTRCTFDACKKTLFAGIDTRKGRKRVPVNGLL